MSELTGKINDEITKFQDIGEREVAMGLMVARDVIEEHELQHKVELNENQQIVLEWLKDKHRNNHNPKDKAPLLNFTEFGWRHFDCTLPEKVEYAYQKLNTIEDAQVLQVFIAWVREQEGE